MRLLSNIALMTSVVLFGYASGSLGLSVMAPGAETAPQAPRDVAQTVPMLPDGPVARDWPALFGEVVIAPEPAPEPIAEAPPEESTLYTLSGIVAEKSRSWAMVHDGIDGRIVRVGDTLSGGETVTGIDAAGVWLTGDGRRQLVPVQRADGSEMVKLSIAAEVKPPDVEAEVALPLARFDRAELEATIAEGGRLTRTRLSDGSSTLDVVWIRQGAFYDKIGLQTGDRILKVNGEIIKDENLLANAPDAVLDSGWISLEIVRDDKRQIIKVNLENS